MKKAALIIFVVILGLSLGIGGFWLWRGRKAPEVALEPEGRLVETTLEERPYITLTPSSDGHWLTLEVTRIQDATDLEYELLYKTASGAMQGSTSPFTFQGEDFYLKEILLGTESSGHYDYDEGVTQGSLTVRLRGGIGTRKFVSDFHLQEEDEDLTSIDGNFTLTGELSEGFYLTIVTAGLPGEIEGEVVAGPYGVFTSGSKVVKDGEVTVVLGEPAAEAKLYSWDGKKWEEIEDLEFDGEKISGSVDELAIFIIVSEPEASPE